MSKGKQESVLNIGIIGPKNCFTKTNKLKEYLFEMKKKHPLALIVHSGGNLKGIELDVKTTALDFGLPYIEYTPQSFQWNKYSYLPKTEYEKKHHYTFLLKRYNDMAKNVSTIVFGYDTHSQIPKLYLDFLRVQNKNGKTIIFI